VSERSLSTGGRRSRGALNGIDDVPDFDAVRNRDNKIEVIITYADLREKSEICPPMLTRVAL
jgi:hypothetical protein